MTMRRLLPLLFVLPLLGETYYGVHCEPRGDAGGEGNAASGDPWICYAVTQEGDPVIPDDPYWESVMTESQCKYIKGKVIGDANAIIDLATSGKNASGDIITHCSNAGFAIGEVHNALISAFNSINGDPSNPAYLFITNAEYWIITAAHENNEASSSAQDLYSKFADIESTALSTKRAMSDVICTNQLCSGSSSGTASCPCVDQWNSLFQRMDGITPSLLSSMSTKLIELQVDVSYIKTSVSNIAQTCEKIKSRLEAPDDRMWTELDALYGQFTNQWGSTSLLYHQIINRNVDIQQLLYQIRHAINGHDGTGNIELSNEGLIALYGAMGSMFSWVTQSEFLKNFNQQFGIFSNTVYTLYKQFNAVGLVSASFSQNNLFQSLTGKEPILADVATNINLSASARYGKLLYPFQSGVTNWFSRMEFYLQDLLGWYEDRSPESQLTENQPKQQTSIVNMLDDGTNSIGGISAALASSSNVLRGVVSPISRSISNARLSVSLPSRVVLFPNVTIMDYDMEFHIDTSEISEYCAKARDITTLLWVVGFWVFCVVGLGVVVKTGIKAALWLIKYISQTS